MTNITSHFLRYLRKSFKREKSISDNEYPDFIREAKEEGEKTAALEFSHARDAENVHMKLYNRAINHLINEPRLALPTSLTERR